MDITTHTPGSICTAVLRTGDLERAAAYYGALVGWTSQEVSGTPGHRLLQFGGRTVASLHQICNATIERAETLGGSSIFVHTVPKHGRIGSLRDPGGAMFVIRGPVP